MREESIFSKRKKEHSKSFTKGKKTKNKVGVSTCLSVDEPCLHGSDSGANFALSPLKTPLTERLRSTIRQMTQETKGVEPKSP